MRNYDHYFFFPERLTFLRSGETSARRRAVTAAAAAASAGRRMQTIRVGGRRRGSGMHFSAASRFRRSYTAAAMCSMRRSLMV